MRLSSIFGLALVSLLVLVAVVDIYSFQTHPRIIAVLRAAFGEASSSSFLGDAPMTDDSSDTSDPTGGFKPLKEWTTSELAAFVERGGHRELREVAAVVRDQALDGEGLSQAFISPTITTESVADALISAAIASIEAASANNGAGPGGGQDSATGPFSSSSGKHHHRRHATGSSSSKSSSTPNAMARARLLWSLESLRFNGGGRPPLWLGLGARTSSSSGSTGSGGGNLRGKSNALFEDIASARSSDSGDHSQVNKAVEDWESEAEDDETNAAAEEKEAVPSTKYEETDASTIITEAAVSEENVRHTVPPLEKEQENREDHPVASTHYENKINTAPAIVRDSAAVVSSHQKPSATTAAAASKSSSVRSNCQVMTYVGEHDNPLPELLELWIDQWTAAGWSPKVLTSAEIAADKKEELVAALDALPFMGSDQQSKANESSSTPASTDPKALRARTQSFLRYAAAAAAGGGWLTDLEIFPVHMNFNLLLAQTGKLGATDFSSSSMRQHQQQQHECPLTLPNQGRITVYQEHSPSLVSGSASAFTDLITTFTGGSNDGTKLGLDWKADPTFSIQGRTERYFAAPKVRGQEAPGFHITELQVFRYLTNLPIDDPRYVPMIGGMCGSVVSAAQFLLGDLAAGRCEAGGGACGKVASKHKWLLPDGASTSTTTAPAPTSDGALSSTNLRSIASRGPLAASYGSRAILDLKKKLQGDTGSLGPHLKSLGIVEAVLGLDVNRTVANQALVRGQVVRAAAAVHAQACAALGAQQVDEADATIERFRILMAPIPNT